MMPLDVAREYFLTPLRYVIARELKNKSWSQRDIASALGVTQAAVSKLLSSRKEMKLEILGIKDLEAELLSKRLLEYIEKGGHTAAATLTFRYWLLTAASGGACELHRLEGWRVQGCFACTKAVYPRLSVRKGLSLADLERAVILAESSSHLAFIAPEVQINIARAAKDASTPADVAAVPGRLARVGSRLVAKGRPAFGVSKHLSQVLLESGYSACIDVKFDPKVRESLKFLGIEWVEFSSNDYGGLNPAAKAVSELRRSGKMLNVAVDLGGHGIEPITYIFGSSAVEVVLCAERIARLAATLTL
ncbi:MAG: hypothetical protein NZ954_05670 [Thermofilaceae archaeon]|nr:hypothetical protein [Thermofilaceae archaeon]MCX8180943.1 hypothetical protein [Thermofilaceae archaeon]